MLPAGQSSIRWALSGAGCRRAAAAGTGGRRSAGSSSQPPAGSLLQPDCDLRPLLQALGFTDNDSAGQTNIFAVEPKTYVAGSSADKTGEGSQVGMQTCVDARGCVS